MKLQISGHLKLWNPLILVYVIFFLFGHALTLLKSGSTEGVTNISVYFLLTINVYKFVALLVYVCSYIYLCRRVIALAALNTLCDFLMSTSFQRHSTI